MPPEPAMSSAAEESSLSKCVVAATITYGMIVVGPSARCLGPNNHGRFSRTAAHGPESSPTSGLGCSTFTRVCFAITAPAVVASLSLELTSREPCIDLRLFKIFSFSMASVVRFLHSTGLHTYAFLIALFVQQTLGYTPFLAGLKMFAGAMVMGVAGLLVGQLADTIESRAILDVERGRPAHLARDAYRHGLKGAARHHGHRCCGEHGRDGLAPRVLDASPRSGSWFPAHLIVDRTVVFGDHRPSALDGVSEAGEGGGLQDE
jgi:hypothetical protein